MKILSSAIDLKAGYKLEQQKSVNERLNAWVDGRGRDAQGQIQEPSDSLILSSDFLAKLQEENITTTKSSEESEGLTYHLSAKEKQILTLLEEFISRLTGKKVKIEIPDELPLADPDSLDPSLSAQMNNGAENSNSSQRAGWGIDYHYEESYHEKETMTFSVRGKILTEDGQGIDFTLNLAASREYSSYQRLDIKAGDALIDPLVINYGGGTAALSKLQTDFDLDADGTKEKIPFLAQGSGFLALDKNNDGVINNGRELFGPASGNGFGELAAYDDDLNNWIDENDLIYKELSIWIKDTDGNDQLLALNQAGIGAIYLGSVDSLFSLKDTDNNLEAQIKKTGIFLRENGEAGTIQHVDFAV